MGPSAHLLRQSLEEWPCIPEEPLLQATQPHNLWLPGVPPHWVSSQVLLNSVLGASEGAWFPAAILRPGTFRWTLVAVAGRLPAQREPCPLLSTETNLVRKPNSAWLSCGCISSLAF